MPEKTPGEIATENVKRAAIAGEQSWRERAEQAEKDRDEWERKALELGTGFFKLATSEPGRRIERAEAKLEEVRAALSEIADFEGVAPIQSMRQIAKTALDSNPPQPQGEECERCPDCGSKVPSVFLGGCSLAEPHRPAHPWHVGHGAKQPEPQGPRCLEVTELEEVRDKAVRSVVGIFGHVIRDAYDQDRPDRHAVDPEDDLLPCLADAAGAFADGVPFSQVYAMLPDEGVWPAADTLRRTIDAALAPTQPQPDPSGEQGQ